MADRLTTECLFTLRIDAGSETVQQTMAITTPVARSAAPRGNCGGQPELPQIKNCPLTSLQSDLRRQAVGCSSTLRTTGSSWLRGDGMQRTRDAGLLKRELPRAVLPKSPPGNWIAAIERYSATEAGANGVSILAGERRPCIRATDWSTLSVPAQEGMDYLNGLRCSRFEGSVRRERTLKVTRPAGRAFR